MNTDRPYRRAAAQRIFEDLQRHAESVRPGKVRIFQRDTKELNGAAKEGNSEAARREYMGPKARAY